MGKMITHLFTYICQTKLSKHNR